MEFEKVLGTVVDCRRLAGTLLPVQQRVAFLQDKVQVVFLEPGELASVTVLVDEGHTVEVFLQKWDWLHICKLPVLVFVLPAFLAYQFFRCTYLAHVLFSRQFRYGKFAPSQHKVIDTCRLV